MFLIGKRYSLGEIWTALVAPAVQRVEDWRSGFHEYMGSVYCLCSRLVSTSKPFAHRSRVRLGQLYWDAESGMKLDLGTTKSILHGGMPSYLFFADDEARGFEYLGRGMCQGLSDGTGAPASVSWDIDRGDGMLCLRKHCDALRRFCVYGLDQGGDVLEHTVVYQNPSEPPRTFLLSTVNSGFRSFQATRAVAGKHPVVRQQPHATRSYGTVAAPGRACPAHQRAEIQ